MTASLSPLKTFHFSICAQNKPLPAGLWAIFSPPLSNEHKMAGGGGGAVQTRGPGPARPSLPRAFLTNFGSSSPFRRHFRVWKRLSGFFFTAAGAARSSWPGHGAAGSGRYELGGREGNGGSGSAQGGEVGGDGADVEKKKEMLGELKGAGVEMRILEGKVLRGETGGAEGAGGGCPGRGRGNGGFCPARYFPISLPGRREQRLSPGRAVLPGLPPTAPGSEEAPGGAEQPQGPAVPSGTPGSEDGEVQRHI